MSSIGIARITDCSNSLARIVCLTDLELNGVRKCLDQETRIASLIECSCWSPAKRSNGSVMVWKSGMDIVSFQERKIAFSLNTHFAPRLLISVLRRNFGSFRIYLSQQYYHSVVQGHFF